MRCNHLQTKLTRRLFFTLVLTTMFIGTTWASAVGLNQNNSGTNFEEQQTLTVTGKVTSLLNGFGLPGVSVVIKGTQTGTATSSSGNYTIDVPGLDAVLIFSFIGYETQEVVVSGRSVINSSFLVYIMLYIS